LRYEAGAVVRVNENSKVIIEKSDDSSVRTKNTLGDVWVNMKKLTTRTKSFEISSPTAVAAIRGTSYYLSTDKDSSTDVEVYSGTVAVGPAAKNSARQSASQPNFSPGEVPGPEEIPGPYEVSLETWQSIVAGQRIRVRPDGKFAQESFDPLNAALKNAFVKRNRDLDAQQTE
jgi:hypothetical protein